MFKIFEFIKERLFGDKSQEDAEADKKFMADFKKSERQKLENMAYDNIAEVYGDVKSLPPTAAKVLLENEIQKLQTIEKNLLRAIKTLRSKEEIEDAEKAGQKILKKNVKPSKKIRITDVYIKNTKTGEVYTRAANYHAYCEGTDENRKIIKEKTYYPYTFPSKVAAYVLPDDQQINERVILEDLIEDIVGASHAWGTYRLDCAEAIWNGEKFLIDHDSYDVEVTMG